MASQHNTGASGQRLQQRLAALYSDPISDTLGQSGGTQNAPGGSQHNSQQRTTPSSSQHNSQQRATRSGSQHNSQRRTTQSGSQHNSQQRTARSSFQHNSPQRTTQNNPSVIIPRILRYLRENDKDRDANWDSNFQLIRDYLVAAHREMVTGGLGFNDPNVRAAVDDARSMVRVHLVSEGLAQQQKTPWTTDILRGQITQERLLTYPKAFPLPEPDRAKSQHRPVKPTPRPDEKVPLHSGRPRNPGEVDSYVRSENRYFRVTRRQARAGLPTSSSDKPGLFDDENQAYERYMASGLAETSSRPPPPSNNDTKDSSFYTRRGWERAALQQCLNMFTSNENRVINTPWRRAVLPYDPPPPLPKEVPLSPRIVEPSQVTNDKMKDPFSWLHFSYEHTQIVHFLANRQRQSYNDQSWNNFSASALPANFRGPHIYRGLSVHDQHWLRIGRYLDNLESLMHKAWGAAPRPLLRAILRDIDAGKQNNTGGFDLDNSHQLPADQQDDMHNRKRYWRRDIKRRIGIDSRDDNNNDDNFKLMDNFDIAWLRYLCQPSRTLEMCDPSKQPGENLTILFDAKLQSYFRNLAVSEIPNDDNLQIWSETRDDLDNVMNNHRPDTLRTVLAYINGCTDAQLRQSGYTNPNSTHPNACYQFSIEEAQFMCAELHMLGRCVYIPDRGNQPARVGRPKYNVHPEDRVMWRYDNLFQFQGMNSEYIDDMVNHYDTGYGSWSQYNGDGPRFAQELEFIMDHVGPDFSEELERVETRHPAPRTPAALAARQDFIRDNLVPEGLYHVGNAHEDSRENHRESPYWSDLATWEVMGTYLQQYQTDQRARRNAIGFHYYYSGEPYQAQTPERTVQFFRNLAYRMGRTMRYVGLIRTRLKYLQNDDGSVPTRPPLDTSTDLKQPRPLANADANANPAAGQAPAIVEKWWHAVSTNDFNLAHQNWQTAIRNGSGDLALLPPDINEVLQRADPDGSHRNLLRVSQDPFTIIREGIIDDCFHNRPVMYPGRLNAILDSENKEYQGFQRPNLFDWATTRQRRFQAPHTRQHFFNMKRWPLIRVLPHRAETIRGRRDEVARIDPSQPGQEYGILTFRLPQGDERPVYAHTNIRHGPPRASWRDFPPRNYGPDGGGGDDNNNNNNNNNNNGGGGVISGFGYLPPRNNNNARRNANPRNANPRNPNPRNNVNTGGNVNTAGNVNTSSTANPGSNVGTGGNVNTGDNMDGAGNTGGNNNPGGNVNTGGNVNAGGNINSGGNANAGSNANAGGNVNPDGNNNANGDANTGDNANPSAMMATQVITAPVGTLQLIGGPAPTANQTANPATTRRRLRPFKRPDEQFAPGPAIFPMGDTLYQKILISSELSNALYPPQPFYKHRLLGLPEMFQKFIGVEPPLIPLLPPATRANIPRSNPRKRKMPIEFLNGSDGSAPRKFRSDVSLPLQPGGSGGQFAAATVPQQQAPAPQQADGFYNAGAAPDNSNNNNWDNDFFAPVPAAAPLEKTMQRVFPDPDKGEAKRRFIAAFPRAWTTTPTDQPHLRFTALRALEFSLNKQLSNIIGPVTHADLDTVCHGHPDLQRFFTLSGLTDFDMHDLNLLAQLFGEMRGVKIQLGVVQEQVGPQDQFTLPIDQEINIRFDAALVGSRYNTAPEKYVVWVRVVNLQDIAQNRNPPPPLYNPYNRDALYNCYQGLTLQD
ncbi:hypothetical protein F4777DRAFT_600480 [Nemania sp. FL0916]|nr:hypothetical protein F4777DRAFT_600480 [Nemania sp. FL0916]